MRIERRQRGEGRGGHVDAGNTTDCLYVTNNTLLSCKDDHDGDDDDDIGECMYVKRWSRSR